MCDDADESDDVLRPGPGRRAPSRRIRDRGALRVGVSADTLLMGSRNPLSGQIEGFDIDMLKAVSAAIFGDAEARCSSA